MNINSTVSMSFLMRSFGDFYKMTGHERGFLQSIQNHADRYLDEVDGLLKIETEKYIGNNLDKSKNPFKPIDRDSVFAVIKSMTDEYKETMSV